MVFHQTFFREGPETFDVVDVDFPIGESFTMIDPLVPNAIGNKTIVTLNPIDVHQAPR